MIGTNSEHKNLQSKSIFGAIRGSKGSEKSKLPNATSMVPSNSVYQISGEEPNTFSKSKGRKTYTSSLLNDRGG